MAKPRGPFYKALGVRIRAVREGKKVSQEALGKAVGLSRASIVNVEKGRQPLQVEKFVQIASKLAVDPATLLPTRRDLGVASADREVRKLSRGVRTWVENVISDESVQRAGAESGD